MVQKEEKEHDFARTKENRYARKDWAGAQEKLINEEGSAERPLFSQEKKSLRESASQKKHQTGEDEVPRKMVGHTKIKKCLEMKNP